MSQKEQNDFIREHAKEEIKLRRRLDAYNEKINEEQDTDQKQDLKEKKGEDLDKRTPLTLKAFALQYKEQHVSF